MPDDTKKEQLDLMERIQLKLLKRWDELLDNKKLSSVDAATIARVLKENGWDLDPDQKERLEDKLPAELPDPKAFDEYDDYTRGRH